jgi:hypothetical protein
MVENESTGQIVMENMICFVIGITWPRCAFVSVDVY